MNNKMYQGEIEAFNSEDREVIVILYWTQTDPLLGSAKAGPAKLLTECSKRRLEFVQRDNGIFSLVTPDWI